MKSIIIVFVLGISFVGWNSNAFAGCDTLTTMTGSTSQLVPELDCVEHDIRSEDCVGGVNIFIKNGCDSPITVRLTEPEAEALSARAVEPENEIVDNIQFARNGMSEIVKYEILHEGETHILNISYDAFEEETGCSTAGQSTLWPVSALFLGFISLRRREKRTGR